MRPTVRRRLTVAALFVVTCGISIPLAAMGVLTLGWRSGAALGPAAAGFLYDVSGSYRVPFGGAPGVVLVSWALFAIATSGRARR